MAPRPTWGRWAPRRPPPFPRCGRPSRPRRTRRPPPRYRPRSRPSKANDAVDRLDEDEMSTTMGRLSALLLLGVSLATPVAAKDLAASLRGKWLVDKEALYKSD